MTLLYIYLGLTLLAFSLIWIGNVLHKSGDVKIGSCLILLGIMQLGAELIAFF